MMILSSLLRTHGRQLIRWSQTRSSSILRTIDSSPVLVSSNNDVYTNLALEHWLYTNLRFSDGTVNNQADCTNVYDRPVVFIWVDEPSIVIGRHQNPWVEANLSYLSKSNIRLARRQSGGGCVYHDGNNINISIIGNRKLFENRQKNLWNLAKILEESYGVKFEPNARHDLIHTETGLKISGSAAKLGKYNCYHHFTLLVDSNKEALYNSIRQNQQDFMQTNSSLSTRSKVINLKELTPQVTVDQVICDLANSYNKLYLNPDSKNKSREDSISGDEADFQSLNKIREELESWDWLYGKTPKFKLKRILPILEKGVEKQVEFVVKVNKGLFETIELNPNSLSGDPLKSFQPLLGTKFSYKEAMLNTARILQYGEVEKVNQSISIGIEAILATLLLQMIHESNC